MKRDPLVAWLLLATIILLGVSSVAVASTATECFLEVDVLDINATSSLNRIDTLTVKIVSLDTSKISHYCPYEVGQQVLIKDIESGDITVSDITAESKLRIHLWDYSALGPNGVVSETTWQILELIKREKELIDRTTK